MIKPPSVGSALLDEEQRAQTEQQAYERQVFEDNHLCLTCMHAPVCSISRAIEQALAGGVILSRCAEHLDQKLFVEGDEAE